MKSILTAVSALGLIAAAPAFAQEAPSASSTVAIGATVAKACGSGNHISGSGTAAGFTQGDIDLGTLADGNGQFLTAISKPQRSFGNTWCNTPATVKIEAASLVLTGATRGTPPPDKNSFANEFHLEVTTSAGVYVGAGFTGTNPSSGSANRLVLDTSTDNSGIVFEEGPVNHAFETGTGQYGGFDLKVLPNANKRPVAGTYTGYVKITATAL
jgi:hypothetical protein